MKELNQLKVSVIIPFYNGAEWLCEAVQSVLDQTYKNLEIIVVNDGSKEDVQPFLDKYGDKIKYFYQENAGSAAARNLAMRNATGDYYALLDSDDMWFPEKTARQVAFMEKTGVMWSHTGFNYWWPETGKKTTPDVATNYGNVFNRMLVAFKVATPTVMFNAKCFKENPDMVFPVHMRKAQDFGLFIQVAKKYPIGVIEEPLANIRMRGTNTNSRAMVRIQVNTRTLNSIRTDTTGLYSNVPGMVKFIYGLYELNGKIVQFFKKLFHLSDNATESFAKVLWVFPFSFERIYAKVLTKKGIRGFDELKA